MQLARVKSIVQVAAKPVLAGLLAAALLLLTTLAASPQLHQAFHSDANAPGHFCLVTVFAKALVHSAPAVVLMILAPLLFGGVALLKESLRLPLADYRFAPSRAPPVRASSSKVVGKR